MLCHDHGKSFLEGCENGTYGHICQSTCGHCQHQDNCYHSNGTCLEGCSPGYQGYLCKTSKQLIRFHAFSSRDKHIKYCIFFSFYCHSSPHSVIFKEILPSKFDNQEVNTK